MYTERIYNSVTKSTCTAFVRRKGKNTAHTYWLHNAAGSVEYFERLAFEFEVFIVKCVKNVSA